MKKNHEICIQKEIDADTYEKACSDDLSRERIIDCIYQQTEIKTIMVI